MREARAIAPLSSVGVGVLLFAERDYGNPVALLEVMRAPAVLAGVILVSGCIGASTPQSELSGAGSAADDVEEREGPAGGNETDASSVPDVFVDPCTVNESDGWAAASVGADEYAPVSGVLGERASYSPEAGVSWMVVQVELASETGNLALEVSLERPSGETVVESWNRTGPPVFVVTDVELGVWSLEVRGDPLGAFLEYTAYWVACRPGE